MTPLRTVRILCMAGAIMLVNDWLYVRWQMELLLRFPLAAVLVIAIFLVVGLSAIEQRP